MGNVNFRKIISKLSAKIKHEFCITFDSVQIRDAIRSSAKNLAGHPDSGMRLEIPRHLQSDFSILERLSYTLKSKHSDIKRNIKYDDAFQGLVLDFCVGGEWKTVRPRQARKVTLAAKSASSAAQKVSMADLTELIEEDEEDDME